MAKPKKKTGVRKSPVAKAGKRAAPRKPGPHITDPEARKRGRFLSRFNLKPFPKLKGH